MIVRRSGVTCIEDRFRWARKKTRSRLFFDIFQRGKIYRYGGKIFERTNCAKTSQTVSRPAGKLTVNRLTTWNVKLWPIKFYMYPSTIFNTIFYWTIISNWMNFFIEILSNFELKEIKWYSRNFSEEIKEWLHNFFLSKITNLRNCFYDIIYLLDCWELLNTSISRILSINR